jgi:hypothetical protein
MALRSPGHRFRGRLLDGCIVAALSLLENPGDIDQITFARVVARATRLPQGSKAPRRVGLLRLLGISISREGTKWRAFLTRISEKKNSLRCVSPKPKRPRALLASVLAKALWLL